MTKDRCEDPRHWSVMTLCRPHAEALFDSAVANNAALALSATVGLAAAFLASSQGDYAGARRLQERALEVMKRVLGEEHSGTLTAMWNLAVTPHITGEVSAALGLLRRCLAGRRRVLGDQHPDTVATAESLKQIGEQPEGGS